jgi:hypothetical protein
MGIKGQYNYKGLNSQAWAAMSLFLQHLKDPHFSYIHLEAPNYEDFNLVFDDGHKIICESKAHKAALNYFMLRKILKSIISKNGIGEKDEVLIICHKLNRQMAKKVEHMKYWHELVGKDFAKKGFAPDIIALLPKVHFWEISYEPMHIVTLSLFSQLINVWVPGTELERILSNLLLKDVYEGSAYGKTYKREDMLSAIENIKINIIKNSGYFDADKQDVSTQLSNIIKSIENNSSPTWAPSQLAAISAQPNLYFFILDKMKGKIINNLKDWDKLWELNSVAMFSMQLYKIFQNNTHNQANIQYILLFIKHNIGKLETYFSKDYFIDNATDTIDAILQKDKTYIPDLVEIIGRLLKRNEDDLFYIKSQKQLDHQKTEICKLLKRIYEISNSEMKQTIIRLIYEMFNLIKDDGRYSFYTPPEIFTMIKDYIISNPKTIERSLQNLSVDLIIQYDKFYKQFGGSKRFNGRELMGGSTAFWGDHYEVFDRHFVFYIITPVLQQYYRLCPQKAWQFLCKECITSAKSISRRRPDYMMRAAIPIIIERYELDDNKISNQAFRILKDCILDTKSIPSKSELIFSQLPPKLSNDKVWRLIEVSLSKRKYPENPFISKIVSDLAKKGHEKAKTTLKSWIKNPDYYKSISFMDRNVSSDISKLLDSSFNDAVQLFNEFINSDYFINRLDKFDAYDVAHLLNSIINKNLNIGLGILKELADKNKLSINQQILLSSSLISLGNEKSDNAEILDKLFEGFLSPWFDRLGNDINNIYLKLSNSHSRESIVDFADRIAKKPEISRNYEKTLRIIKIFINDKDPFLPGKDPEDPEAKYNEHKHIEDGQSTHLISSVRGKCAWALMDCATLRGRPYLTEIIKYTKKLASDENHYIKHMVSFPLSQLAMNRLSVMPEDKVKLFLNDDISTALKMAKEIEAIAFDWLGHISSQKSDIVKKSLAPSIAHVFNHIRMLNEKDANKLLELLSSFPDESMGNFAALYIYFAEYREGNYEHWKWHSSGLYDDLRTFNGRIFKEILERTMLKSHLTRRAFAWELYRLIDSALRKVDPSLDYDSTYNLVKDFLLRLISEYDHDTFESVYRFIDDNIIQKDKFDECYSLWRECLKVEKPALEQLVKEGKGGEAYWWPSHNNGETLIHIKNIGTDAQFLDSFEFLLSYPREIYIGDVKGAVNILKSMPKSEQMIMLFIKLVERNSNFFDDQQEYLSK